MVNVVTERLFGVYEKALPGNSNWGRKTESAKAAGFDFVELCIDESDEKIRRLNYSEPKIRETASVARNNGLVMHSLCLSAHRKYPLGSEDANTVNYSIELTKRALDFAGIAGLKVLQIAGYDVFYEPSSKDTCSRFVENLGRIATLAEEHDVMLGLENVDNEMSKTIENCMSIVRAVDSPCLAMYPDFANMSAQAVDYIDEMPKAKGHIVGLHIKDTKPHILRNVAMGTGTVDFDRVFSVLREMNCFVPCVIEMWNEDREDSTDIIRSALQFIKAKV